MNCPECNKPHSVKKSGMTCSGCQYQFVIDPGKGSLWTDQSLTALAERTRNSGSPRFTRDGMRLRALKESSNWRKLNRSGFFASLLFLVLATNWFHWGFIPTSVSFVLAFIPFSFWAWENTRLNPLTRSKDLDAALDKFHEAGRKIEGLIELKEGSENYHDLPDDPGLSQDQVILAVPDQITQSWLIENGLTAKLNGVVINRHQLEAEPQRFQSENLFLVGFESQGEHGVQLGPEKNLTSQAVEEFKWPNSTFPVHALPLTRFENLLLDAIKNRTSMQIDVTAFD